MVLAVSWAQLPLGCSHKPQLLFNGPFAAGAAYAGQGGLFITGDWNLLIAQLIGSGATIAWSAVTATLMFAGLAMVNRLRVNPIADQIGIDVYEHGASAWPDVFPLNQDGAGEATEKGNKNTMSPVTGD
jgi:Amt family ammonium transporter